MTNPLVNRFVSTQLSSYFKSHGFKKRRLRWSRRYDSKIDCIEVKPAKYGTEQSSVITINFGVFFDEVWRIRWNEPRPKSLLPSSCAIHFRIGAVIDDFIPMHADNWWELSRDTLLDQPGGEIQRLSSGALERMSQINDYPSAVKFIEESFNLRMPNDRINYLILRCLAGDDGAKVELSEFEPFGDIANRVLARLDERCR